MEFSVKSVGFSKQADANPSQNVSCQPLRKNSNSQSLYKVNFGNGESQVVNGHGDSLTLSGNASKATPEAPLSFGQKFTEAALKVAQKLNNKNDNPVVIGKELGKEIYGVDIN